MKFLDLLQEAYSAISMNKVRSGLTILGIIVGISSVVAMISIGQGTQREIQARIEGIGSNLIVVLPGFQIGPGSQVRSSRGSAQTLTLKDADAIQKQVPYIKAVAPEVLVRYQVTTKGANTNTLVVGITPSYSVVRNIKVEIGSFISSRHLRNLSKVAVLGPTTRDDLFGENVNPIGRKIRINKISFTVIGVTQPKGGTGFINQDDRIFIPLTTAQHFLIGDDYLTTINIQVQEPEYVASVQQYITDLLLARHNILDFQTADFFVMSQSDILKTATSITSTLTVFLAAVAGISLIVGGIGIMNMMLTTVTERTREIGLRKAIGAKNREIALQFLTEAVMLTLIGGIIGIVLGWLGSLLITKFTGISTKISMFSVLLAFGVSAAIGIGFGYYPAKRAASLNPIEALRYE
ncbi:ABC transporter permease [bacterium]|nr:ABC transporter permease [bacterium]